ncbi:uncharacterized protein [Amphiura filiformis]|uniref:uncharacterized protein n=1 Tax=Amphiura filiformis TaxID=82378 RepID=UPI003B20CDA3
MSEMAAANAMIVLEQGDTEQPRRPTSGRVSINKVPIKRSGSSLEIIPPQPDENGDNTRVSNVTANDERPPSRPSKKSSTKDRPPSRPSSKTPTNDRPPSRPSSKASTNDRPPSRPSSKTPTKDRPPSRPSSKTSLHRSSSHENVRHSQSAGSPRKKDSPAAVSGDVKRILAENDGRSSSAEARIERCETPPKKQVYLPSVRRNYEQHGMPKDDALDVRLREGLSSPIEQAAYHSNPSNGDHDNKGTKENIDALLERLSMRVDGSKLDGEQQERKGSGGKKKHRSQPKPSTSDELADSDAYYTSPGTEKQHEEHSAPIPHTESIVPAVPVPIPPSATDPYYISHGAQENEDASEQSTEAQPKAGDESSSDEDDTEDEDEEPKAPIELLGEFVEAVMDEEWEDADKLCKMVLMYEPDNAEAKQFQPLIEEMLRREREEELYGSDSDENGSSDEEESDEDESGDEDDSDEESSSSESESEDKEEKDDGKKEVDQMEREAKMMKAIQNGGNDGLR